MLACTPLRATTEAQEVPTAGSVTPESTFSQDSAALAPKEEVPLASLHWLLTGQEQVPWPL